MKPGLRAHQAEREAEILQRRLEHRQAATVAVLLFDLFETAKPDDRLPPGLVEAHAGAPVVVHVHLEMRVDFIAELTVPSGPGEQPRETP